MKLIKNSDGPHATSHAGHSEKNGEKNRFFRCVAAKPILHYIYPSLQILMKNKPFKIFKLALNIFPTGISEHIHKMALTIIQIAMYIIWNNRNKRKFHKQQTHLQESKNSITKAFQSIIKQKFQKYMPHGLQEFREHYCHTPQLCNVTNNDTLQTQLI